MPHRHPGGDAMTRRLLDMAALAPCRVLDMGAGAGGAVRLLRARGFDALGLDREPGPDVERGDFLRCPWPDGSFDALLSECAFFVSGDLPGALREAARLLRPGGRLLLADVFFGPAAALEAALEAAGFAVLALADETAAWRAYYLACVWDGTAEALCGPAPRGRCGYYLTVSERRQRGHGRV